MPRSKRPASKRPRAKPSPTVPMFDWRAFDPSAIPDDGDYSFRDELTTYRDRLDELLEHEGEYVVIKGCEIIGFYTDETRALFEAARRFGEEPALVKKIVAREPIGIINHTAL